MLMSRCSISERIMLAVVSKERFLVHLHIPCLLEVMRSAGLARFLSSIAAQYCHPCALRISHSLSV